MAPRQNPIIISRNGSTQEEWTLPCILTRENVLVYNYSGALRFFDNPGLEQVLLAHRNTEDVYRTDYDDICMHAFGTSRSVPLCTASATYLLQEYCKCRVPDHVARVRWWAHLLLACGRLVDSIVGAWCQAGGLFTARGGTLSTSAFSYISTTKRRAIYARNGHARPRRGSR